MEHKVRMIANFRDITGADEETSRFYLESCNFNFEAATEQFFESGGVVNRSQSNQRANPTPQIPQPTAPRPTPSSNTPSTTNSQPRTTSSNNRTGGVFGFSDLNNRNNNDSSNQGKDKPQTWYTGGSKSGVMVEDAKVPNTNNPQDFIRDISKITESQGRHKNEDDDDDEETEKNKSASQKTPAFSGEGIRLGNTPGTGYRPPQSNQSQQQQPQQQPVKPKMHIITVWSNGFTLDEGPIRNTDDPANKQFMDQVRKGIVPNELAVGIRAGQEVPVKVINKSSEEWKAPPPVFHAFEGRGNVLDSDSSTAAVSAGGSYGGGMQGRGGAKVRNVTVDETQPVTTVQVWLADGSKIPMKVNHMHTIDDLRGMIDARSGGGLKPYRLQTNYPVKILEDHQTIKDSGLMNAVVVQKMI